MRTLTVVLLLALASPLHAQSRFANLAPYVVFIGGETADAVTTAQAIHRGGHEAFNGVAPNQSVGPLLLQKALVGLSTSALMRICEQRGHARLAHGIGYLDGALMFTYAIHNARVGR